MPQTKSNDPHARFWGSPDNRQRLCQALAVYQDARACEDKVLLDLLCAEATDFRLPTRREFKAILSKSKRRDAEPTSGTLYALCRLIEESDEPPAGLQDAIALREAFADLLEAEEEESGPAQDFGIDGAPDELADDGNPDKDEMDEFLDILSRYMKIDRHQILGAKSIFFSQKELEEPGEKENVHRKRYEFYRYYSDGSKIAKSFMVITAQRYGFGTVCFFVNFFPKIDDRGFIRKGEDNVRIARGIVVPTNCIVYLIGEIEGGSGMKIVAVNKSLRDMTYHGLLLSFEGDDLLISARFLMKETRATNHNDANLRIRAAGEFRSELGNDLEKLKHPQRIDAALSMWWPGEQPTRQRTARSRKRAMRKAKVRKRPAKHIKPPTAKRKTAPRKKAVKRAKTRKSQVRPRTA